MAQRTIARLYDSYDDAARVVAALEAAGIPSDHVSLVGRNHEHQDGTTGGIHAGAAAGTGATIGTLLGGGVGLLAGIGSLAIPGVGPVVAAGWLIATLTGAGVGAAAGGLLGSLTGAGVSEDEAHVYAEGVRRGGSLVSVKVDEAQTAMVLPILDRHGPADWRQRGTEYRQGGWDRFDAAAGEYVPADPPARTAPPIAPGSRL